ncbi:MAG: hypothetical protein HC807_02760, partial [Gammaproteobacteria bacterium]|nr:hypothetical protein [Gammaproteobacteria bacterium]
DAMFNQHAKWLKVSREIPWRARSPSLRVARVRRQCSAALQRRRLRLP